MGIRLYIGGENLIILSQTEDTKGYHGTIGKPTNMCDSSGNPLFIGDIVTMYHKDYTDKSIAFVCEEDHNFAKWTNDEHQYVMGISSVWNSERFKAITASIYDDNICDQIYDISENWNVQKVKDFAELVIGERLGFLYVRDVTV